MKLALVLLALVVFFAQAQAQTQTLDPVEVDTEMYTDSDYTPSSSDYDDFYSTDPLTYTTYDDDITTAKPFKHQILSMLFKKG